MIFKEKDRRKVIDTLVHSSIPPVVIQQWILHGCIENAEAWKAVVEAEEYTNNVWFYSAIIGSNSLMGGRFRFPSKLRGE